MAKRILATLALLCLLLGGLSGCGDDGTGQGFRFPLDREPIALDPQMAADTASITVISTLFEGLTRLDKEGTPLPAAADWTVSEDGLTYTFTLRESSWSTIRIRGQETPFDQPTPVTADDFLFAFQRAVDPTTGSSLAVEFDGIQNAAAIRRGEKPLSELGVSTPDRRTLIITLEKPDDSFLTKLSGTPFMPCNRAFFEYTGGRYGLEEEYVLSNGAFRLAAWNHNESLLLYKHEAYHQAEEVTPEAVRFVIDVNDMVTALTDGSLDAAPLTTEQMATLGNNADYLQLEDQVRCLWFNTSANPFTVSPLRLALRDSVDWNAVNEYLQQTQPYEQTANHFVPPDATICGGTPLAADNTVLNPTTNVSAAKEALQQGLNILYPDSVGKLRFELLASEDALSADLARYLVQSWQKNLNIYPTLTLLPEAELAARVKSGNYQAAIYIYSPSGRTGAENLSCFSSTATDNLSRLNDHTVDTALRDALSGGIGEWDALEQALWQACPCVPLSYPTRYYGIRNSVKIEGVSVLPFGGGRFGSPLEFREAKKFD